jgi:hypothetical protein
MKKNIIILIASLAALVCVNAADAPKAAKDKVVTGVAKCAKCALKESDTCQTVIEVKKGNKKTTYFLADNEVSKSFHKNICTEPKNVKATIAPTDQNGKTVYMAKSIEVAK